MAQAILFLRAYTVTLLQSLPYTGIVAVESRNRNRRITLQTTEFTTYFTEEWRHQRLQQFKRLARDYQVYSHWQFPEHSFMPLLDLPEGCDELPFGLRALKPPRFIEILWKNPVDIARITMHLKTAREHISPVLFEEAGIEAKGGLYARWKTDDSVPILHFVNITRYQRVLIRRIDSAISRLWANVFNTPEPFLECIGAELMPINVRAQCRWSTYWTRYTTPPDDTTISQR